MLGALSAIPDIQRSEAAVGRLLVLSVIVLVWSMAESAIILHYRGREQGGDARRGYGFVAILLGLVLLGLLNIFRARSSQGLFLITLGLLSIRGMSRAGWEQNRPRIAFAGALLGATLLALLSFLAVSPEFVGEKLVFSLAIGAAATSVEAAWFGEALQGPAETRWALPLYRIVLFAGPVIVATMALAGHLPMHYTAVYLTIPLAARTLRSTAHLGSTNLAACYRPAIRVYLGFIAIIIVCRFLTTH